MRVKQGRRTLAYAGGPGLPGRQPRRAHARGRARSRARSSSARTCPRASFAFAVPPAIQVSKTVSIPWTVYCERACVGLGPRVVLLACTNSCAARTCTEPHETAWTRPLTGTTPRLATSGLLEFLRYSPRARRPVSEPCDASFIFKWSCVAAHVLASAEIL